MTTIGEHDRRAGMLFHGPFTPQASQEAQGLRLTHEKLRGRKEAHGITFDRGQEHAFWVDTVDGRPRIYVSYIDVSAFIPMHGSDLERAAYDRGFSMRFGPAEDSPMLPDRITKNLLRLIPGQTRPAITVTIPLDKSLHPLTDDIDIDRTYITNKKAVSFRDVDAALENEQEPSHRFFSVYSGLARDLAAKRKARGDIEFWDLERGIRTTESGKIVELKPAEAHESNVIMREFILLANEAVAAKLVNEGYGPLLFRNQAAKPHATSRDVFFEDLRSSIDRPDLFDREVLRQRAASTIERAYFGTDMRGHYGHHVPAFIETASPRESYAGLVTQRIMAAYANGEDNPYAGNPGYLTEIGKWLTLMANRSSEQRRAWHTQQAEDDAMDALTAPAQSGLVTRDPDQFSRIIELVARENALTPEMADEIQRRLGENALRPMELYLILTSRHERTDEWQQVHASILEWLKEHTPIAAQIFNIAFEKKGWSKLSHDTPPPRVRAGNITEFTVVAQIKKLPEEEPIRSDPKAGKGTNKKSAEHKASLDLLAKVLDLTIPEPWPLPFDIGGELTAGAAVTLAKSIERPADQAAPIKDAPAEDFKTRLNVVALRNGLTVAYPVGKDTDGRDVVQASVIVGGSILSSQPVIINGSTTKEIKAAQQQAARSLLAKLLGGGMAHVHDRRQHPSRKGQRSIKEIPLTLTTEGDWKGALITVCQRAHFPIPKFSTKQLPSGEWEYTIIVRSKGKVFTIKASDMDKKIALENAVEDAYTTLHDLE